MVAMSRKLAVTTEILGTLDIRRMLSKSATKSDGKGFFYKDVCIFVQLESNQGGRSFTGASTAPRGNPRSRCKH
jgi:hypothetical protein